MSESNQILGYVIGPDEDAITVCSDCADEGSENRATIRDGDHYGTQVPYSECYVCGEVMRP